MYRNLIENFMKPALASFLILLASALPLHARPLQPVARRPLVFTQVSIIDATGAPLQPGMTIVIRDGRIVSVVKTGRVRIPRGAQIVVAQGKFLVPGLWDRHAHLGTDDFDKQGHLALFLANGVTGIRIMDGDPAFHKWRAEISGGALLGPRMVIGSPILGQSLITAPASREVVRQAKLALNAARFFRRSRDWGTIEQGKFADLVLLDAKSSPRHPQYATNKCGSSEWAFT